MMNRKSNSERDFHWSMYREKEVRAISFAIPPPRQYKVTDKMYLKKYFN